MESRKDKFVELQRQERSRPGCANPNEPIRKLGISAIERSILESGKFKKMTEERGIDDYRNKLLGCHGRMNGCGRHKGCRLHGVTTTNN